jgi:hypothetical protein
MLGLVACGSQSSNYPPGPVLFVTPTSFTYTGTGDAGTVEPNLAAYIGTQPAFSIDIEDHGQKPLTITDVTLNDPSGGFQLVKPAPGGLVDGGTVALNMLNTYPQSPSDAFISFYFIPTKVGPYTASITITSNSADGGTTVIPITALGVSPDAGEFTPPPDGG